MCFLDEIYTLSLANTLPTLPFEVFRQLLDNSALTTDDGVLLRRMCIDVGAIHLVLNCLSIFTHHSQMYSLAGVGTNDTEVIIVGMQLYSRIDYSILISQYCLHKH